jgi:hypothetical protein
MLGIFMNGILLHYWFRLLDLQFGSSMKSKTGVFFKIIADQIAYAPTAIILFFSYSTFLESEELTNNFLNKTKNKLKSEFLTTYAADCVMWPIVNFVNFRFVAIPYRPTFVGSAQLFWQTYMSKTVRRKD